MADSAWVGHPLVGELLTRCGFPPPGTAVTCAVSGGADSTALLALAVAAGCEVTAVHVDHGLRPGSADEAAVVARSATLLGAAFRSVTVHVGEGPNLEARARSARYAALPADVLTGHTADDQAETVLVNLLRGAGVSGIAGMRADARRPLLGVRRADTERLCELLARDPGVLLVHDPSNLDPRHLRNRVRHELLPLMADLSQRDPVPVLARQAALARDDAEFLDTAALAIDPTDARQLAAAPAALARRAVRRWLTGEHPPDAATVERVMAVARGEALGTEIGGGRRVTRHARRLVLRPEADPSESE
ncbi:MAG: tRNA lysidine(34) synthetase TilS [Acidobacteria bacterium]|nr:tRNA lysidine(34) synthetase TilS [Acidobacteriota bacterium]